MCPYFLPLDNFTGRKGYSVGSLLGLETVLLAGFWVSQFWEVLNIYSSYAYPWITKPGSIQHLCYGEETSTAECHIINITDTALVSIPNTARSGCLLFAYKVTHLVKLTLAVLWLPLFLSSVDFFPFMPCMCFMFSSLSTRFGTVAVPNILLFQGAKPMARFNHTDRTLETLKDFIFNQTGM